jgi:GT2 family glycosyltransferase
VDRFPSRERAAAVTLGPRISAIVVTHNTGRSLDLCLRSALAEPWIDELIVVDTGNPADVSSALRALQADRRDVSVVAGPGGISAAAAANLGAAQACGRWLLFLDPHVVLQRGAAARMAAAGGAALEPWIVGGRLTDTTGRDRRAARAGALNVWSALAVAMDWPRRRVGAKPRRGRGPANEPAPVGAVSGAFMLIPRAHFAALGGFDEGFVTDAADLDLCRRAREAGGGVLFEAGAAGVQFSGRNQRRREAQGLARFAIKSARTPLERVFAAIAGPALALILALRDFIGGRPPTRKA